MLREHWGEATELHFPDALAEGRDGRDSSAAELSSHCKIGGKIVPEVRKVLLSTDLQMFKK